MKARKWTEQEAIDEIAYIQNVDPQRPGSSFNNDPACFRRYVDEQRRWLIACGHEKLAERLA